MADLSAAASASTPIPTPTPLAQTLDNHISLLASHLDFLHTLQSLPPASASAPTIDGLRSSTTNGFTSTTTTASSSYDHSTVLSSMISRAAIALHDARICGKNYRDYSLQGAGAGAWDRGAEDRGGENRRGEEQEEGKTEESLPLRHKRPSEVNAEAEVNADTDGNGNVNGKDGEGGEDAAGHTTKRRRRSSGRQARPTADPTAPTSAPPIEYTDITTEVNLRLAAREERRRARILQYQSGQTKRKRRSSLGDSLYFAGSDDEDGAGGGMGGGENGGLNGMSRRERKMERARRISAGGTRKIKRVRVRKETDRGVEGSVPVFGEVDGRDVNTIDGNGEAGTAATAADGVNGHGKHADSEEAEAGQGGVKIALNDVDVDGAPAKSAGSGGESNSKAKKRRRSSFVRSQGQDGGVGGGGNKHALDDRSTKRRRR